MENSLYQNQIQKKSQEASIENILRSNDNTKNETKASSDLENMILRELKK